MRIKKTAVGNANEAYIEERFHSGINIISSDDNNKGKTIEIQSMMYALGNEPAFPTTFNYKNYYHYIEFEVDQKIYRLCRSNDDFVLKYDNVLMLFDNVSEMKRYWNKHIFPLPSVMKNQIQRIVDPVLFLQLFFVGQDKKDTSNISHAGLYNKSDYYNMLYDICELSGLELDQTMIMKLREKLLQLKTERELLLKQYKILQSHDATIGYLSTVNDRKTFEKKISEMEKINSRIAELRKARNNVATRRASWETTLKELRSLNRTMECGELRCMIALIIFMVLDYITGLMCAVIDKKLSSAVGFKGICKKVLILMLVGVANVVDIHIVGTGSALRSAVICFYLSNEGLSLLENAAHIGLPIPDKMKDVLAQLHGRIDEVDQTDDEKDGGQK